jgi:hypothetical protein
MDVRKRFKQLTPRQCAHPGGRSTHKGASGRVTGSEEHTLTGALVAHCTYREGTQHLVNVLLTSHSVPNYMI